MFKLRSKRRRQKNADFFQEYCRKVGEALTEIICNSTNQIGLALGADISMILEEQLGFKDETSQVINILSENGSKERIKKLNLELNCEDGLWNPIKGNNRRYKVISRTKDDKKAIVICTWNQRGTMMPGENFKDFERELLSAIESLRQRKA